ncbi:MAG: putative manganese-dependent inorganic diphosphatase [Coriobacteriia bacterium]|nr:putative manganese-dependent inorganic diphosphatase [Coriobacteriia bacterium]
MGPILVFGHKNPDNDSISSAVAYAHLKNLVDPGNVYVPARLGPVPKETRWVFERFGVQLPEEIAHVRTRVRDVMTEGPIVVSAEEPMLVAGRLMREHGVRGLPVVDIAGHAVGLVSERVLAERYLDETELAGFQRQPVTVDRLVRALDATLVTGDPEATISGDVLVGAAEPATVAARVRDGDTVIVGDRLRTQPMVLAAGVACLISTGGFVPASDVVELAKHSGAALIVTPHDTYSAARLVTLAHAVGDIMDTDVLAVGLDTLLSEAAEDLIASPHREAVVTDEHGRVVGMLTRTDVARGARRRVALVDHNEAAQSAVGIEDAAVVEIVDHHRVGDIQSAGPILFLNLPLGSTATIIATRFQELGVEIPESIAGILLGAVLTDTVLLKSPTTTPVDRRIASDLARIIGVEPLEYGMDVFRSRSVGETFSAEKIVSTDAKEFRVGELRMLVAQHETVDVAPVLEHVDEVRAAMEAQLSTHGYDAVVLMITDIVREGSEILAVGASRPVERALGISLATGSAWMPGVLSRKKQIAARLVDAAG